MTLTTRPRLYLPVRDENGDLLRYARVRLLQEDGKTPFAGRIYRDGASAKTYSNPFVVAPALINVYFDEPVRIRLGVQPDVGVPEVVGNVIDVIFDADQTVDTTSPLNIIGTWSPGGLLCGIDASTAYWKPLRVDHEHAGVAPSATLVGVSSLLLRQAGAFQGTTVVGAATGGWGAHSSLKDACMLGYQSDGYGRGTVAIGYNALAEEADTAPWSSSTIAVGRDTSALGPGVALGSRAATGNLATAVGPSAQATAPTSVALGAGARPATQGVAIGVNAGAQSAGMQGSVGLGAGAQYGLPSSTDPGDTAVLLGAYDPTRARAFPWTNPNGSQSESPFDEFAPTMAFTGRTVQLQRGLEWLADIAGLQVAGDATLGGLNGRLGFYGRTPVAKVSLGDDEPSAGIPALDNLIFALRDLGLLRYRTEASMTYQAADLGRVYLDGDKVTSWPEHSGTDTATGPPPVFRALTADFNGLATVRFDNSVYQRSTRPPQELRGGKLLASHRWYVAVASHEGPQLGLNEGLLNLSYLSGAPADENQIFSGSLATGRWRPENVTRLEVDGLNQTGNRDAGLPGPHVYAAGHTNVWPHARPVIGGPRDNTGGWDRWSGNIAELVGMDDTWELQHVQSMAAGLAFKYGIGQPASALRQPATDFLLTQHDPMNGTLVFWTKDYADAYLGKVTGRATRVPKPVIYVPFISIYIAFSIWSFRGSLVGNWGNLALALSFDYEVQISVKIGDLDEDGDIDVSTELDVHTETHLGIFALNSNFTWTMGRLSSSYGFKICRIRHRVTKTVICISGDGPFRYADTDVNVYSTKSDGSLLLEQTVPLWGDGTFKAWIGHTGKKVARVVERSTGNTLGTTEYQEKALPRTQLYADDDPEQTFTNRDRSSPYEAALTAMGILEMPSSNWYRARHILSTLRLVRNDDGTLNEFYSAVLPAKESPSGDASSRSWGATWTILAVLRYQQVTGDGQFLSFAQTLANTLGGQTITDTHVLAALYFAMRDLGALTGTASYTTLATTIRGLLLNTLWIPTQGRFRESTASDAESLRATVMGGLFLLAIGDRPKAQATIRHLKRYRVKNVTVGAPHYTGQSGLIGYKPYADAGSSAPHLNPPAVIDQTWTWAAILFKMRYGEPVGDDVAALYRFRSTTISGDPTHDLYSPQFLRYSANATSSGYNLRARPHLSAASWGLLLSTGAKALFPADPLPVPTPTSPTLGITLDAVSGRYLVRFGWRLDPSVPAAAYEAVVETSTNAGSSWSAALQGALSGQLSGVVDVAAGQNAFAGVWTVPAPDNSATLYRVRIRVRNVSFGPWVTTPTATLPAP